MSTKPQTINLDHIPPHFQEFASRVKTAMLKWLRNVKMDRLAVSIAGLVLLQRYMILKARA